MTATSRMSPGDLFVSEFAYGAMFFAGGTLLMLYVDNL